MAELVDAPDLGSGIERCAGSSPVPGTFNENSLISHKALILRRLEQQKTSLGRLHCAFKCIEMSLITDPIAGSVAGS